MAILIVNSLLTHDFPAFIVEKIKEREVKVIKKKELEIKALSEFVNLFKNTNYISCKRIIFLNIFQTSQRGKSNVLIRRNLKRSRDEFEEEKKCIEIEILQKEKDKLEMEMENLKAKIDDMKASEETHLIDMKNYTVYLKKE